MPSLAVLLLAIAVFLMDRRIDRLNREIDALTQVCVSEIVARAEALHRAEKNVQKHTIESGQ